MWRRYEFPGHRVALDFLTGQSAEVVALVDLQRNVAIVLGPDEWTHLHERVKYIRSLAVPKAGLPDWPDPAMPEPEWHRGCTGCWCTVWHTS
jgi:hypothetical protein